MLYAYAAQGREIDEIEYEIIIDFSPIEKELF